MIISPIRGQVIDLLENNQIVAAVCMEERKGKFRILTESGREVHAGSKQILHLRTLHLDLSQAREALTRILQACAAQRELLATTLDILGLWEVLKDETDDFSASALAELAWGAAQDDQIAAVFSALHRERIHFRNRGGVFRPTDEATVTAILTQRAREEEKAARLRRVNDWLRAIWDGQRLPTPPEGPEIVAMLKDLALNGEEARARDQIKEILHDVGLDEEEAPFQLLVRLGEWQPDENLMLLRQETRCLFPAEIQAAAAYLANTGHWAGRTDLSTLTVYTVDSVTTRDVDDGLSLTTIPGGFEVGIHITDLTTLIQRDAPLDVEARLRGTSIYLPDLRIPMLPPLVSEDLGSLNHGVARPALSLFISVDAVGTVQTWRFAFTVVRVTRRTYQEVDAALASAAPEPWQQLLAIAQAWRAARWVKGALFLSFPEITITLGENGQIAVKREESETPAQIIVSEMMIQANHYGAQALIQAGLPGLYRGQAAPRERLFEGMMPNDLWLNYRQRMQLSRAETKVEPIFHHGLGVAAYATISSPLRRYADLVNQRQLAASLRGDPPIYTTADLEAILITIERPVSQAPLLEQNRRRYWLLRFLEQQRGLETKALIIGIYGQRIQVVLPDLMLETSLPANVHPHLQLGQWLQVRIARVRALADILRLDLISTVT